MVVRMVIGGVLVVALMSMAAIGHCGVYASSGQALQTIYAVEETLLDKVIAATKVGVRSTATGRTSTGWAISRFTGATLAPMLTISIAAAGIAWSPYLLDWIEEQGWTWNGTGVIGPGVGYTTASGAQGVGASQFTYVSQYYVCVGPGTTTCMTECQRLGSSAAYGTWNGHEFIEGGWSSTYWATACYSSRYGGGRQLCMYPKPGYSAYVVSNTETKTSGQIETEFQTDFGVDGSNARKLGVDLVNYLGDKVKEANRAWPGAIPDSAGYSPLTSGQGDMVQTAFNDAIDPQAKQELEDNADENGSIVPGGSPVYKDDWEYTPEEQAAAQKQADLEREAEWLEDWNSDKPEDGNGSVTAGDYTLPERKDLPGVLDTFKSAVDDLPIISWVSGVTLEVSGASSQITLALPEAWGGGVTVDFADYETILDTMGNGLYAIVGMASILFLFRGRGD